MTVHITSGKSGWGNYVLYGTKEKPRDSEKVEFIEGDIALGDRLSQSNNYEESYYKIVLSFDRKVEKETALAVYEDFKKEFFVGFKEDEYHIDTVLHRDTDYDHFHMRVPKQNLKTDTHLQLYMDKIDRPRKQLIQDHLSLKYGFEIAREKNREIFKEEAHEHINKWRKEHNQKPFDFKSKEGKKEAEQQINSYVSDLIKSELITSQDDVKSTLEELGLTVERFGHDEKKDFYYATVSNESGKIRVKGDVYNDKFYEYNREDRSSQIDNNRRIEPDRGSLEERAKEVRRELNRANEKRYAKVTKLFSKSRERAEREHKQTLKVGRVESLNSTKHIKSIDRSNIRNSNNNNRAEARAKNDVSKRDFERQERKSLYTISSTRAILRPTEKNVLLSNQIRERANERLINETIERVRREREASAEALQRARSERELIQSRITRDNKELQNRVSKIANYYGKIREKVVNTINEVKESIKDRLEKIKEKYTPKEKQTQTKDHLKEIVEDFEANQGEKSDSSNILNKKELTTKEKYEQNREVIREQMKANNEISINEVKEPSKKKSFQRQR